MTAREEPPSLESLQRKLEAAEQAQENPKKNASEDNAESRGSFNQAMRLSVELLGGLIAGALVGYALDQWLGTAPWLIILCIFLGLGGGFLNLMRAAQQLDKG